MFGTGYNSTADLLIGLSQFLQ